MTDRRAMSWRQMQTTIATFIRTEVTSASEHFVSAHAAALHVIIELTGGIDWSRATFPTGFARERLSNFSDNLWLRLMAIAGQR